MSRYWEMMEVDKDVSINKFCRTCLTSAEPLINLFKENDNDSKISLCGMILSFAFIELRFDDGLSDEICHSCAEKAYIAYSFKNLCEKSDAILRKSNLQNNEDHEKNMSESKMPPEIYILEEFTVQSNTKDLSNKKIKINKSVTSKSNLDASDDDFKEELLSISPAETKINCTVCSKSFENHTQLREHKKIHPSNIRHNCHICGKSFSRVHTLQHHMVTHTEYRAHLCPMCGKRFHLAGGLRQHLKYHRGIKPHICEMCDKSYYNLHLLREHIRCAHSANRYNNSCSICNKKFTAKSTLKMHMKIHTGERSHGCEICGKRFTRAAYLKAHYRQHTQDPPPRMFVCPHETCERMYTTKASLNIHIRHRHTRERPFACEVCEKSFSSMPGLTEHRRVHTGEKPEECVLCKNRFVNKQSLKKHMRLHTGERPYPCDHCEERFLSSSRRNEHVQTKHMERQHECSVCHKRFHLKRTLKGHLRIHSTEKRAQNQVQSQTTEVPAVSSDSKQNVPEPRFEVIV